jgi:hypothetical protein
MGIMHISGLLLVASKEKGWVSITGFYSNNANWHICKHDVYCDLIWTSWISSGEAEQNFEDY